MADLSRVDLGMSQRRWLKAELHSHCNLDPIDSRLCAHSAEELILAASRSGYDVLAITCHDRDVWSSELAAFATSQGILLIPGMEVTTEEGKHLLVYNFGSPPETLNSPEKILCRVRSDTLVVAPHAFFPNRSSLRGSFMRYLDCVDAIEHSGFFSRHLNFNPQAALMARAHRKPIVSGSDLHHLWQIDRSYTLVYAMPTVNDVVAAIKQGMVQIRTEALSNLEIVRWWMTLIVRKWT